MDCLLINSPDQLFSDHLTADPKAPLGLLHIAAYIRENGADVAIIDCHAKKYTLEEIIKTIQTLSPLLVGLNITTPNRFVVYQIVEGIKDALPNCTIIIGGPHATCFPKDIFKKSLADGVVIGEGEETVLRILQNLPKLESFHGFISRLDIEQTSNFLSNRVMDLDTLPIPAYDLIDTKKYLMYNPELYISSGRGCSHNCSFCSARLQYGKKTYFRSHETTIREIALLKENYDVERFYFYNENLSVWPYLEQFSKEIQSIKIRWSAQANINDLQKEIIPLLGKSGCYGLGFGIESGSKDMQTYIGKIIKSDSLEKFSKLRENGIDPRGFFVIGFPDENKDTIFETAKYLIAARLAGLTDIAIFPARPYPGTRLYNDLVTRFGEHEQDNILGYKYLEDHESTADPLIRMKFHRYNTISTFQVCDNYTNEQIRSITASLYHIFFNASAYKKSSKSEIFSILFSRLNK